MRSSFSTAGGFRAGVYLLGGDQELDVINVRDFRGVQQAQYERTAQPKSTA
jgi:hypothetical protein